MKEYFENGIKVYEYSFQDWLNGRMSTPKKGGRTHIPAYYDREAYVIYLPHTEYEKIMGEVEKLYWELVDQEFQGLNGYFGNTVPVISLHIVPLFRD